MNINLEEHLILLITVIVLAVITLLLFLRAVIKKKKKGMQLRIHRRTCLVIFEEFRHKVRIDMTSEHFSNALADSTWIEESFIYPITALSGWLPLEWYSNSICYCINLYPDTDNKSDYAIWFRILKPEKGIDQNEIEDMGIKFLKGELKDETVTLQEFTLCQYKTEEFEFFPPREEEGKKDQEGED